MALFWSLKNEGQFESGRKNVSMWIAIYCNMSINTDISITKDIAI